MDAILLPSKAGKVEPRGQFSSPSIKVSCFGGPVSVLPTAASFGLRGCSMIVARHALIWIFVGALSPAGMGPAATREASARPINYVVSAVQAAFAGRYSDAERMAAVSGNSAGRKLVEWVSLRQQVELAGYERLMNFALSN